MKHLLIVLALSCSGCAWLSRDLGHTEADYAAAQALARSLSRDDTAPMYFPVATGAETCFIDREKVDGLNKICTYSCPSGKAAITIKSYELCPLNIKR